MDFAVEFWSVILTAALVGEGWPQSPITSLPARSAVVIASGTLSPVAKQAGSPRRAESAAASKQIAHTDLAVQDVDLDAHRCERFRLGFHRLLGGDAAVFGENRRLAPQALAARSWEAGVTDPALIDRIVVASGFMRDSLMSVQWIEYVIRAALTGYGLR